MATGNIDCHLLENNSSFNFNFSGIIPEVSYLNLQPRMSSETNDISDNGFVHDNQNCPDECASPECNENVSSECRRSEANYPSLLLELLINQHDIISKDSQENSDESQIKLTNYVPNKEVSILSVLDENNQNVPSLINNCNTTDQVTPLCNIPKTSTTFVMGSEQDITTVPVFSPTSQSQLTIDILEQDNDNLAIPYADNSMLLSPSRYSSEAFHRQQDYSSMRNPDLMQSSIPEEPLHINVETDDEYMHSWRPNISNSLSSDFFLPQPLFLNTPTVAQKEITYSNLMSDLQHERHGNQTSPNRNVPSRGMPEVHVDIANYLQSQKAQVNVMKYEVMNAKRESMETKEQVDNLNYKLKLHHSWKSQDIKDLSDENAQLRLECQCLCMEVDYYLKGDAPLGEIDEKFYQKNPSAQAEGFRNPPEQPQDVDEEQEESHRWECSKCTFANHPAINTCEMCHMQRRASILSSSDTCFCHPGESS